MIVWAVHSGCKFEGGGIDALFETEQKAVWYCKHVIKDKNKGHQYSNPRRKRHRVRREFKVSKKEAKEMVNRFPKYVRSKHDPHYWDNGYDYISARPWKVL